MALTRGTAAVTDDSGGGIDGTVFDAAWKALLDNEVDGRWTVSVITLTGTQNNLATSEADFLIFNNATDLTITGIAAPSSPTKQGKPLRFVCIGAGNVFFAHNSGSSSAGNKLLNYVSSGNTPCSAGTSSKIGGSGTYVYGSDGTTSYWRLTTHEQGAWITPTFAAGDYTGNGSMTWTVDSGDVQVARYRLDGRTLHYAITVNTTTVAGTPSTGLQRTLFGGFTAASAFTTPAAAADNGAAISSAVVVAGTTLLTFFKDALAGSNWTASTNATYLRAVSVCEVT